MPMALRPMLTPTTFDTERLWRRNLRDNDGDGEITGNDGVDLNRNLLNHWALNGADSPNNQLRLRGHHRGERPRDGGSRPLPPAPAPRRARRPSTEVRTAASGVR
jgi:hypothetical protein